MSPDSPFSSNVVFVCQPIDETGTLLPEEAALLTTVGSQSRRKQVVAGRAAARHALALLGAASQPVAIPRDEHGAPIWPEMICGSISHTARFAAAAVAQTSTTELLGLDIEERSRLISDRALNRIASPAELAWIQAGDRATRALQLFTAKEAWYKAIHPRLRRVVEFSAVRAIPIDHRTLALHPTIEIPGIHHPLNACTVLTADLVISGVESAR